VSRHGDVDEKTRGVDFDPEELRAKAERLIAEAERAEAEEAERKRQAEVEREERERQLRYLSEVEQRRRALHMAGEAKVQAAIVAEAATVTRDASRAKCLEIKQYTPIAEENLNSLAADVDTPLDELVNAKLRFEAAKTLPELVARNLRDPAEAAWQQATENLKWKTNDEKEAYQELVRLGPAALEGVVRPESVPDPTVPTPRYSERDLELLARGEQRRAAENKDRARRGVPPR
jgi:hypothetical protein